MAGKWLARAAGNTRSGLFDCIPSPARARPTAPTRTRRQATGEFDSDARLEVGWPHRHMTITARRQRRARVCTSNAASRARTARGSRTSGHPTLRSFTARRNCAPSARRDQVAVINGVLEPRLLGLPLSCSLSRATIPLCAKVATSLSATKSVGSQKGRVRPGSYPQEAPTRNSCRRGPCQISATKTASGSLLACSIQRLEVG